MKILIREKSEKYSELVEILDSSKCDFLLYEQEHFLQMKLLKFVILILFFKLII